MKCRCAQSYTGSVCKDAVWFEACQVCMSLVLSQFLQHPPHFISKEHITVSNRRTARLHTVIHCNTLHADSQHSLTFFSPVLLQGEISFHKSHFNFSYIHFSYWFVIILYFRGNSLKNCSYLHSSLKVTIWISTYYKKWLHCFSLFMLFCFKCCE